jgi:uncharacterized protein (UPF0218 family)
MDWVYFEGVRVDGDKSEVDMCICCVGDFVSRETVTWSVAIPELVVADVSVEKGNFATRSTYYSTTTIDTVVGAAIVRPDAANP